MAGFFFFYLESQNGFEKRHNVAPSTTTAAPTTTSGQHERTRYLIMAMSTRFHFNYCERGFFWAASRRGHL